MAKVERIHAALCFRWPNKNVFSNCSSNRYFNWDSVRKRGWFILQLPRRSLHPSRAAYTAAVSEAGRQLRAKTIIVMNEINALAKVSTGGEASLASYREMMKSADRWSVAFNTSHSKHGQPHVASEPMPMSICSPLLMMCPSPQPGRLGRAHVQNYHKHFPSHYHPANPLTPS